MHQHFTITSDATEFGQRMNERMYNSIPSGPRPAGSTVNTSTLAGIEAASKKDEPKKPESNGSVNTSSAEGVRLASMTPAERAAESRAAQTASTEAKNGVKEIVKDGKITTAEKKTVLTESGAKTVKDEQKRLEEKLAKTENTTTSAGTRGATTQKSEHNKLVADLGTRPSIADLDAQQPTNPAAVAELAKLREARIADETKVAGVIKDRAALIGTLEAEKLAINEGVTPAADALKDPEVKKAFETFAANGGQLHTGNNIFGDDWNEAGDRKDLNTLPALAEHFQKHPDQLDDFLARQGDGDGAIDKAGSVDKHVSDLYAAGKLEEGTKVANRSDAAETLKAAFEEYNTSAGSNADSDARLAEIDTKIATLEQQNLADGAVLSDEVRATISEHFKTAGTTTTTNSHPGSADALERRAQQETGESTTIQTNPPTSADAAERAAERAAETPVTQEQAVDYSTPEARQQVATAAQDAGLVPAGTTFDEGGNATYAVQPGDSYWRISEGATGGTFDPAMFNNLMSTNVPTLNYSDPALLEPNDVLVIPGRSVNELVALLGLPTTTTTTVEPEAAPIYTNDNGLTRGQQADADRYQGQADAYLANAS